jgi:hypothetical protein
MKKPILVLLFVALATPGAISSAPANDDESMLVRIANYRRWTNVTPEPIKVTVPLAMVEIAKIDPALVVS